MVIRRVNGIVIAIVILVDGLYLLLCDVLSRLSERWDPPSGIPE